MRTKGLAILLSFALATTMCPFSAFAGEPAENEELLAAEESLDIQDADEKAVEADAAEDDDSSASAGSTGKKAGQISKASRAVTTNKTIDTDESYYWSSSGLEKIVAEFTIQKNCYISLWTYIYKGYPTFTIKDSSGNEMYSFMGMWSGSVDLGKMTFPKGTYSLEITSLGSTSVGYSLETYTGPSAYTYETETNDGLASADPAVVNRVFAGSIFSESGDEDSDYYEIEVVSGGYYKLKMRAQETMSYGLYDEMGALCYNSSTGAALSGETTYSSSMKNTWFNLGYLNPGIYYVLVQSSDYYAIGSTYSGGVYTSPSLANASVALGSAAYVTVSLNGTKLVKGTDYSASYKHNTNTGKATVKITGKGRYRGSITKVFTIKPQATGLVSLSRLNNGFKAKWTKRTNQVTGYQVSYRMKGKTSWTSKNIVGCNVVSKNVTGLKDKKTYQVRVRTYKNVNGVKYFSKWSGIRTEKTK